MKIRVISLRTSKSRRENVDRQFKVVNLPFEFFDAITGHEALQHVHHYDDSEFIRNSGRSATANEIGCYASHLALWRRCAAGDEPFLILEDDARLCDGFRQGLSIVADRINRLGLIRVSVPLARSFFGTERAGNFHIRYCRRVPLLAVGYSISPAAAARLMSAGTIVREPVDKFMQRFWLHHQPVHALQPQIIRPDDIAEVSDIGDRPRVGYGLAVWARRLLRKSENSIRRDWYVLRLLIRRRVAQLPTRKRPEESDAVYR